MRILIVDDDRAALLCLGKVLEPLGEVVTADNGRDAVDIFGRALAEGDPFTLVCLDIVMPGLDGQSALKAIRELEKQNGVAPGRETKVVMVTSCDDTGNVSSAFFKGQADGYVTKPLRLAELTKTLGAMGFCSPPDGLRKD